MKRKVLSLAGGADKQVSWPLLRWSCDGAYFVRVHVGQQIEVYESASMELLDDTPLRLPGGAAVYCVLWFVLYVLYVCIV